MHIVCSVPGFSEGGAHDRVSFGDDLVIVPERVAVTSLGKQAWAGLLDDWRERESAAVSNRCGLTAGATQRLQGLESVMRAHWKYPLSVVVNRTWREGPPASRAGRG